MNPSPNRPAGFQETPAAPLKTGWTFKIFTTLKALPLFLAAFSLLMVIWLAAERIPYPFTLEWTEGGLSDQVTRLVNGQSIYGPPSLEFTPFLYPPVYFYLSAGLTALTGFSSLLAMRLVSFGAALASLALIFGLVRRETKSAPTGLLAAGLFAASFRVTGAWLDVARVDSLFLACWLGFLYAARGLAQSKNILAPQKIWLVALTGGLAGLAFLTKQTALIVCLPVFAALIWQNWKRGLAALGVALALVGAVTLAFEQVSGGWFSFYVYGLLFQQTEWIPVILITFWRDDLLNHLPIALLLSAFFFISRAARRNLFWLAAALGGLAGAFLTRAKVGGYDNVLLPAYAIAAILFGLGLRALTQFLQKLAPEDFRKLTALTSLACIFQFVILAYNPYEQLPSAADRQAGELLVRQIASAPAEIYLPDETYLARLAGKRPYANQSAIWDIVRGAADSPAKEILQAALAQAIRAQVFDQIIFDSQWQICCAELETYYAPTGLVAAPEGVFYPLTGARRRPTYIYTARRLLPNSGPR